MTWCILAGAGLVTVRLWRTRPFGRRTASPAPGPPIHRSPTRRSPINRSPARRSARLLRAAALSAGLAVAGVVVAGPIGVVSALAVPLARRRRTVARRRATDEAIRQGVEQLVLLTELALHGGVTLRRAVDDVVPWLTEPVAGLVAEVLRRADTGASPADEFERLADRFPAFRGVAGVVGATERYGAPAAPGLRMLRDELRHDQRYRLERAARAVPVHLVFPLVVGVFPAFVLLAVVPMVAAASAGVRLVWS